MFLNFYKNIKKFFTSMLLRGVEGRGKEKGGGRGGRGKGRGREKGGERKGERKGKGRERGREGTPPQKKSWLRACSRAWTQQTHITICLSTPLVAIAERNPRTYWNMRARTSTDATQGAAVCRSMDGRWSPCSLSAGARRPVRTSLSIAWGAYGLGPTRTAASTVKAGAFVGRQLPTDSGGFIK